MTGIDEDEFDTWLRTETALLKARQLEDKLRAEAASRFEAERRAEVARGAETARAAEMQRRAEVAMQVETARRAEAARRALAAPPPSAVGRSRMYASGPSVKTVFSAPEEWAERARALGMGNLSRGLRVALACAAQMQARGESLPDVL